MKASQALSCFNIVSWWKLHGTGERQWFARLSLEEATRENMEIGVGPKLTELTKVAKITKVAAVAHHPSVSESLLLL